MLSALIVDLAWLGTYEMLSQGSDKFVSIYTTTFTDQMAGPSLKPNAQTLIFQWYYT